MKKKQNQVFVCVLNMRGKPLMPTKPAKAKHLLKKGKAVVVKRCPFTIQLKYATGENKQNVDLGIDPGYKKIGFSARTRKAELMSGEVNLRTDIPALLKEKAMYRRGRRHRNTEYRPPRFDNRNRQKGWLSPSTEHKINSHLQLIKQIKKLLPVTKIRIEVAKFDSQKMQNPEIKGDEYTKGTLHGYEVKEYLLEKFHHKCVYCGKTDIPLEVEHLISPKRGGTNRISNLTIACHKCNQKKNNMTAKEFGYPKLMKQCKESLKASAFMNIMRYELVKRLKKKYKKTKVITTFGYKTKKWRVDHGIKKSHINDAFAISKGTNQKRCKPFTVKQNRRNNRAIQLNRKGFKPSIRKTRYKFQPNDLVRFNQLIFTVKGVQNYGQYIKISDKLGNKIVTNIKNVELITYGKGLQFGF